MVLHGDIGAYILGRIGTVPGEDTGTVNGTGWDRLTDLGMAGSCKLMGFTGVAAGGPTTQTVDISIQDSADNSTFAAYLDQNSNGALTQITADSTMVQENVDLRGANQYIRAVAVMSLAGGTTPTWPHASVIVFGGFDTTPTT